MYVYKTKTVAEMDPAKELAVVISLSYDPVTEIRNPKVKSVGLNLTSLLYTGMNLEEGELHRGSTVVCGRWLSM